MFDTHCHLNFKRFKKNLDQVIARAVEVGVKNIVIPGTDVTSSKKAIEIVEKHEGFYAAVGIHPHHAFKLITNDELSITNEITEIETLLTHPKVVSIGEVGMDRHEYQETKYQEYAVDDRFIDMQMDLLKLQIRLAVTHKKSLILHNREAQQDLLPVLEKNWDSQLEGRAVFHCCEPDLELLGFAKKHKIFIGVDGDITYDKAKQDFIKQVPLGMLVVETDSPFILPEPLLSEKKYPNEPANIQFIVREVASLKGETVEKIKEVTTENGKRLFTI